MEIEESEKNLNFILIKIEKKIIYTALKRLIDFIFSLLGIILLFPLFIIIAILIKLNDNNGPVLFVQERIGRNQTRFKIYKFRTMYHDAEERLEELLEFNEIEGAMFKMKNDPRVTKIGFFLRKSSLDELPQLFNVLKGNMSLVGPRPPLVREVEVYSTYDKQRLLVKPGITGLWQVSGRNSLSFNEMVDLDLQYIENLSIFKDIKILFLTILVVLRKEDAY